LRHIGDVTVGLSTRGRNIGPKQTKILGTNLDEWIPRQVVGAYQQFPEAIETLSPPCLFANRYAKLKPHPTRLSSFLIGGCDGHGGAQGTPIPLCRCPVRLGPRGLFQPWRPSFGHARHCLV